MSSVVAAGGRAGVRPAQVWSGLVLVAAAGVAGAAAAGSPLPSLAFALVGVTLAGIAYAHPPAAAYILVFTTPLIAGIERNAVLPVLRPHEAVGLALGAGVVLRALVQLRTTHRLPLRVGRIDVAIILMATAGSVVPLLWMVVRGLTPAGEDLFYAAVLWKFYGLFVLIRACVRSERQVLTCLWLTVAAGGLVAVVAIFQTSGISGLHRLVTVIDPLGGATDGPWVGRGSATLGTAISVGDVMAFDLAICLGLLLRTSRHRVVTLAMAVLFTFGAIATGQVSGMIAVVVAVFAVAAVTGQFARLLFGLVPTAIVGGVVLRPVVAERLAYVDVSTGLPESWTVRLENLRLYVWPDLFSGYNWLFGVRPSAMLRVDAPWGSYIFIESGYTWLLWTGGVPLAVAFLYFTWVAARTTAGLARRRRGPLGVAAVASFASLLVVFALMPIDPHLTMRGTADLMFSLLALATAMPRHTRSWSSTEPTPGRVASRAAAARSAPGR